jgi:hypothetical protein
MIGPKPPSGRGWVYDPAGAFRVPTDLKQEVQRQAQELIHSILKPRHVHPPPQKKTQFNYLVDIHSQWPPAGLELRQTVWGCKQWETTGSARLRFGGLSALWPAHASYRRKPRTQGRVVLISYRLLRVSACLPAAISSTGNQNSFPRSLVLSLDFVRLSTRQQLSSAHEASQRPNQCANADR